VAEVEEGPKARYVCGVLITYRDVGCPGNVSDTDETKAIYFNCIRHTV